MIKEKENISVYEKEKLKDELVKDFYNYCELLLKEQTGFIPSSLVTIARELYINKREMALLYGLIEFKMILLFENEIQTKMGIYV